MTKISLQPARKTNKQSYAISSRPEKGDLRIAAAAATTPIPTTDFDSSAAPLYFLDDEALRRRGTHNVQPRT
ncbi:hypothetical protein ANO11243_031880 [Dothideomycetidae sp. 11243]|nr:hypothetical protein ANO11243_031880 [fungal sp. No.11243]